MDGEWKHHQLYEKEPGGQQTPTGEFYSSGEQVHDWMTAAQQLNHAASGLEFLHRMNLVHGSVRGVSLAPMVAGGTPF